MEVEGGLANVEGVGKGQEVLEAVCRGEFSKVARSYGSQGRRSDTNFILHHILYIYIERADIKHPSAHNHTFRYISHDDSHPLTCHIYNIFYIFNQFEHFQSFNDC